MDWTNFTHKEPITRFIFSKSHYSSEKGKVKYGAFVPPQPNPKISVFRIRRLSQLQIWSIAEKQISPSRPSSLKARGDLAVKNVFELNLDFIPDTETHHRHANISGWPDSRDEVVQLAGELAHRALLHLFKA